MDTHKNKLSTRLISLIMTLLISLSMFNLPVYAEDQIGGTGDGTVEGQDQSTEFGGSNGSSDAGIGAFGQGGWKTEQQDFRLYMVEKQTGNIVSSVLDFEFPGTTVSAKGKVADEARGYKWNSSMMYWSPAYDTGKKLTASRKIYVSNDLTILDGMPKFTTENDNANGNAITEWALELDDEGIHKINRVVAVLFSSDYQSRNSVPVLKAVDYGDLDMYDAYMEAKVALVIEPVYWYIPAGFTKPHNWSEHKAVNFLEGDSQLKFYAYGGVHNLAEQSKKYGHRLYYTEGGKTYYESVGNAGGWCGYISDLWPHALQLSESDPEIPPYTLVDKPGGKISMDDILDGHSGYNLRVYQEKDHPDKWATYLARNEYYKGGQLVSRPVGGGKPPVNPPKQGAKADNATRPVKIIKIYEDILVKNDGTEEIENSWLKYDWQTSYSRIIEIQDEPLNNPQYKVEHWYTAVDEGPWGSFPWADTWEPWERGYNNSSFKGESSTTVEVPDYHGDQAFDVLIVHRDYSYGYKGCSKSNQVLGGGTLKYF